MEVARNVELLTSAGAGLGLHRAWTRFHLPVDRSLTVHATDVGRGWRAVIGPDPPVGIEVTGDDPPPGSDCTVRGPASDLYLPLWNRRDAAGLDVTGDDRLLDAWRTQLRVRWR